MLFQLNHLRRIHRHMKQPGKMSIVDKSVVQYIDSETVDEPNIDKESGAVAVTVPHNSDVLEVVLCPENVLDGLSVTLKAQFPKIRTLPVARFAPQSRLEFEELGKLWPIVFRPSEIDRLREQGLDQSELKLLETHLNALMADASEVSKIRKDEGLVNEVSYSASTFTSNGERIQSAGTAAAECNLTTTAPVVAGTTGGGVIVNPVNGMVVATSSQALRRLLSVHGAAVLTHPLFSPTTLCIDAVATIVREMEEDQCDDHSSGLSCSQYLCTGLDLLLTSEPDLQAAMALVHSRIRRVTYLHRDSINGALGSVTMLHTLRALNHRFRVFQINIVEESQRDGEVERCP